MTLPSAIMDDTTNAVPAENGPACCRKPDRCCAAPVVAVPLTALRVGQCGVVCETCLSDRDAAMLRAMGLRPKARVRICRLGEPCIVEVMGSTPGGCGCRIGLARPLAERIMIGAEN